MKPYQNPFLRIAASLALLGCSAHAADVTLTAGTYTDTQIYNNGTISGVVTFNSGANYTFDNLNLPLAWNRVTLNSGAALNVAGNLSADVSGVSLNGGTLTTGGLLLHDSPNWNGSYNDGKQTIEYGDSIINGATIVANQSNANFISMAGGTGAANGWVANNLWLGNDGATIDSGVYNIGITMALGNFFGQTGKLSKTGSGTLTLSGNNTYSGGTTLSGGTLRLENTSALGTGGLSMGNNTTLQLRSDSDATFAGGNNLGGLGSASITIDVNQLTSGNSNKTLSFAGGGFNTYNTTINATGGNGYTLALGGINEGFNGPLTLNADSANLTIGNLGASSPSSSLNVGGAATTTVTGAINTVGNFTKSGSGTLNLTGTSSFASVMIFAGGIVNASTFADNGTNSSLGAGTGDPNADAIGLVFRGGTLQYTGSTAQSTNRQIRIGTSGGTIDASGSGTLSFTHSGANTNLFEAPGARKLTLTGSNTGNNTFAIKLEDQDPNATSLTKSGEGKWVLTGTSTYTGATTVSAGTLLVTGALGNTAVSVESNATVGGSGAIGGTLSFGVDSFFDVFSAVVGNDPLAVTGTVSFGSGFGINNLTGIDWASVALGTYTLIDSTQDFSLAGLDNWESANAFSVGGGKSAYFTNGSLQVVVIPEPGAALLGGLGMLVLLRRRR